VSRVLVTGASGFIGPHALRPLVEAGHEVHAVARRRPPADGLAGVTWHQADLLERPADVVAELAPERLLHLAWCTQAPVWTDIANVRWVEATLALVRAFAAAGGARAVLTGTCAEYEWGGAGSYDERRSPLRPATLYGIAKHATRTVVEAAAGELDIETAWGRVFFLYGPGESENRLVPAITAALIRGEPARTGPGELRRDYLHVADAGAALAALVDADVQGAVNIASGEGPQLRALAEQIARIVGRDDLLEVGALPPRPGDPEELIADVTRLRDEVGFEPRVELADGLASTVAWWRERVGT
jgi:nucleoside-diphosphate-sugar epimerase